MLYRRQLLDTETESQNIYNCSMSVLLRYMYSSRSLTPLSQLDTQINAQLFLREAVAARDSDNRDLKDRLLQLVSSPNSIRELISTFGFLFFPWAVAQQSLHICAAREPAIPLAVSPQKRITDNRGDATELQLYTQALADVKSKTRNWTIDLGRWMICRDRI